MNFEQICLASITLLAGHFSFATPLQAAPKCSHVFIEKYFRRSGTEIIVPAHANLTAKDYDTQLSKVDSLLGGLKKPKLKTINIVDDENANSFDPIHRELFASWKLVERNAEKHSASDQELPLLVHEYGHAILDENLRESSPTYSRILNNYHSAVEKYNKTQDSFDLEMIHPYHRMILMIHELFADVTAVTVSKDPAAVYAALPRSQASFDLIVRNFNSPATEMLSLWSKLPAEKLDIYSGLAPARLKFWSLVKTHIHSKEYQERILPKMTHIMANEIEKIGRMSYNDLTHDLRRVVNSLNYNIELAMSELLIK